MNYLKFFVANRNILLFAVILTFFSGFGQTFLLSLYIPKITSEFSISPSLFSALYASATLCSGLTIIFAGRLIDRIALIKISFWVIVGFVIANLVAGLSVNLFMVFIGFFLLRFFGQGLLSHTSVTSMGRYFTHSRGKALSIAYLGYPLAEAIFPITIVSVILSFGWRESFFFSAAFIALTLLPVSWLLLKDFDKSKIKEPLPTTLKKPKSETIDPKVWSQKQMVRDLNFYIFAPTVFIVGFTLTSLFFFQTYIAEFKGWSLEWMALSITAYAIGSFTFSIATGPIIDRFSARKVFPFVLLPMATGLLLLILFQHPAIAALFWFLTGATAGANPTTGNALYAETYGVSNLGSIRSIFTFVMVSSTAAGPVVYSLLINAGFNYNHIHLLITGFILLNITFIMWGLRKQNKAAMQTSSNDRP